MSVITGSVIGNVVAVDPLNADDLRETVSTIIDGTNDGILNENANKDRNSIPTRRDLIAGAAVKDYALSRMDKKYSDAHKKGIIHIHDLDYFSGDQINCSIPDVVGMFKNGTVISDKVITTPRSLQTAATLLSQIIAQVASNQYGGTTINNVNELLAPYLRISHDKYKTILKDTIGDEVKLEEAANILSSKELSAAIQTISYQISTLSTSNGQTPFVTMSLRTDPDFEFKEESNRIISEILDQRIKGIPGVSGTHETQIFPKLIFVTNDYNVPQDSEFHWLLRKAAECTASRMYPDYVSEHIMGRDYEGQVFAPMGCVAGRERVQWWNSAGMNSTQICTMWNILSMMNDVKKQPNGRDEYMDLDNVQVSDSHDGIPKRVECLRIIKNYNNSWLRVRLNSGITLEVTANHPMLVVGKGRVLAENLVEGDSFVISSSMVHSSEKFYRSNVSVAVVNIEEFVSDQPSYDVTTESDYFDFSGICSHNCRSFLPPYYGESGAPVVEGRFNKGVATVNVPRCAIEARRTVLGDGAFLDPNVLPWVSGGAMAGEEPVLLASGEFVPQDVAYSMVRDEFWNELDKALALLKGAQLHRVECLKGTKASSAPMLWMYGALARFGAEDVIDPLFYGGYSTLSLGYVGLHEATELVCGVSNFGNSVGESFALEVVKYLEGKADIWNSEENVGWSVYGTPSESLVGRFASLIQAEYGPVRGLIDDNKRYLTNSFHVCVTEETDAFTKLMFESQFQPHSKGGTISYVEMGDLRNNIDAILSVITFAYKHILYSEFNGRSNNVCLVCGHEGNILIRQGGSNNSWGFECPKCHNRENSKIIAVARMCGYLGDNRHGISGFKLQEFNQRVVHI